MNESAGVLSVIKDAFLISLERIRGYFFLKRIGNHITVMGSARVDKTLPLYQMAKSVGHSIANNGFSVLTGGGPGLMQAANQGAWEANKQSFGVSIKIPHEQKPNDFMNKNFFCQQFCSRKFLLIQHSDAIVFLPGGYGTFDELFETLTLIKTGRLQPKPLYLVGETFWKPMIGLMKDISKEYVTISDAELSLMITVKCEKEFHDHLTQKHAS